MYYLVGLIIGGAMVWMVSRGIDGLLDFFGLTVFDPPRGLSPFERGPRPEPPGFPVLPPLAKPVGRPPHEAPGSSDAPAEGDRWKN
jgi:hypothetical protein